MKLFILRWKDGTTNALKGTSLCEVLCSLGVTYEKAGKKLVDWKTE